jgi:hypothetical protein
MDSFSLRSSKRDAGRRLAHGRSHNSLSATSISCATIVVRPPAVDVMATAIFGTNDHFVAVNKQLLAEGAAFFKKWGMTADTNGANHQHQPGTATLSIS